MKQRIYWKSADRLASSTLILCLLAIIFILGCERLQESSKNLAKIVMEGTFEPQPYRFKMTEDEALTFVYNPALKDKVPEAAQKAVEDAKAKIIAGELKGSQTYLEE